MSMVRYVFYLGVGGVLRKWDSQKHPRDAKGRWAKVGTSAYIYGKNEQASFGQAQQAQSGSGPSHVELSPGDRVWKMPTGSRIVQHPDGTGDFYVNSNPKDKVVLSASGVENMLNSTGQSNRPELEQTVPGFVVKANNERDADRSIENYSPKQGEVKSFNHPTGAGAIQVRVPDGSEVHQTSTGYVVAHEDGSGTVYKARTGSSKDVLDVRSSLPELKVRTSVVKHPDGNTIAVRRATGDKLVFVDNGVVVVHDDDKGHFYPSDPTNPTVPMSVTDTKKFVEDKGASMPDRSDTPDRLKVPEGKDPLPETGRATGSNVNGTEEERKKYVDAWESRGRTETVRHSEKGDVKIITKPSDKSVNETSKGILVVRKNGSGDLYREDGSSEHMSSVRVAHTKKTEEFKPVKKPTARRKNADQGKRTPKSKKSKSNKPSVEEANRRATSEREAAEKAARDAVARYAQKAQERNEKSKESENTKSTGNDLPNSERSFSDRVFKESEETVVSHSELGDIRVFLEPGAKIYQTDKGFIVLYIGNKPPVLYKPDDKAVAPGLSTHEISQLPAFARISLNGKVAVIDSKGAKSGDDQENKTNSSDTTHSASTNDGRGIVYVSAAQYADMMEMFKSLGITEVDGIPVKEKYKVKGKK